MVLCQEGFEVDEAQATLEQQISEKNGYSYCLWVKAGNEHSYPQHINCIFFCKTQDFSQYLCFYILWLT